VIPKEWELGVRWGMIDCDDGMAPGTCSGLDSYTQASVGMNYYFWKHSLRAQLAYDYFNLDPVEGDSASKGRIVFQVSTYF